MRRSPTWVPACVIAIAVAVGAQPAAAATVPAPVPLPIPIPVPVPVTVGIPTSSCPSSLQPADQLSEEQYRGAVLCLINDQRARAGRHAVRADARLRRAAVRHAGAMVSQGFFSHSAPGGRGMVQRIRAAGYLRGAEEWSVGENLAWGTERLSAPAVVVDGWIQSAPHRHNLLRPGFDEIGIGVARGTPEAGGDGAGVTVTTDYGYRD